MHETTSTSTPAGTPRDDVWGVNRPPVLPPTAPGAGPQDTSGPTGPTSDASGRPGRGTWLDRALAGLSRSPLRRDRASGVIGGVSAGLARTLGVSPAAVRVAAVLLAMFFGLGVGAYLIAWALLPDEQGRTHAGQALRDGDPGSLAVVALASVPVLATVVGVLGGSWPLVLTLAVVAYVVARRKGHLPHHTHG